MLLVQTRTAANSEIEYFCLTDGWVKGRICRGDGYTHLACEHCGVTLDDDYLPMPEIESPSTAEYENKPYY